MIMILASYDRIAVAKHILLKILCVHILPDDVRVPYYQCDTYLGLHGLSATQSYDRSSSSVNSFRNRHLVHDSCTSGDETFVARSSSQNDPHFFGGT
jgi:hypothetical protein